MLRPYAVAAGVEGIAPHDCRRYADSRIMPNGQRCGPTREGLDTTRFGISNVPLTAGQTSEARVMLYNTDHCCPAKSRIDSTGCRDRVNRVGSPMLEEPVK